MGERKTVLKKVENFLRNISEKYGIRKVIIFGSYARGDYKKDSDVDIVVVGEKFRGKSSLERPVNLYLEWNLDYPVDFICYTPEEFDNLKNKPSLVRKALKEGKVIEFG